MTHSYFFRNTIARMLNYDEGIDDDERVIRQCADESQHVLHQEDDKYLNETVDNAPEDKQWENATIFGRGLDILKELAIVIIVLTGFYLTYCSQKLDPEVIKAAVRNLGIDRANNHTFFDPRLFTFNLLHNGPSHFWGNVIALSPCFIYIKYRLGDAMYSSIFIGHFTGYCIVHITDIFTAVGPTIGASGIVCGFISMVACDMLHLSILYFTGSSLLDIKKDKKIASLLFLIALLLLVFLLGCYIIYPFICCPNVSIAAHSWGSILGVLCYFYNLIPFYYGIITDYENERTKPFLRSILEIDNSIRGLLNIPRN
jgi:membrane associated rhomboid family serine protease